MSFGIVEDAVNEEEMPPFQPGSYLLDFLHDSFGRTQPVAPPFQLRINAIDAPQRTAAFGLHTYKAAPPKIPGVGAQFVGGAGQLTQLRDDGRRELADGAAVLVRGDDPRNPIHGASGLQSV